MAIIEPEPEQIHVAKKADEVISVEKQIPVGSIIALSLLEEIADHTKVLEDAQKNRESIGEILTIDVDVSESQVEEIFRNNRTKELISLQTATVKNKGSWSEADDKWEDATIRLWVNYPGADVIVLDKGESALIDLTESKKKLRSIYHQTVAGTATLRVVGKY